MGKGYLFISNSTKPTAHQYESIEPVTIGSFAYAALNSAKELGYTLYCGIDRNYPEKIKCTNFDVIFYNQHIYRKVLAIRDNYTAYKNLCSFLKTHPDIEIIHCNTPIGGVLGRLCGYKFHKKVIYQAHGFHFFKGASIMNWLLFYPVEKILARLSDAIITINHEDYEIASKKFKLKKGGEVYYIPGVGIESDKYNIDNNTRNEVRSELGLKNDDIAVFSIGDLVVRKNYEPAIRAIKESKNTRLHLFICGDGVDRNRLENITKNLSLGGQVHFLGHRNDIIRLLTGADIFLLSSKQEGLPRSLMEGMVMGLPCVVSNIRGNIDLIKNGEGGFLCETNNVWDYADKLNQLARSAELRAKMGIINKEEIKKYNIEFICKQMLEIYKKVLKDR